jgi:PIN domain nuclease of toxin-antitoxin system
VTGIVDSHTLIWLADRPDRVGPAALAFVRDPGNRVVLSLASVWELSLNESKGKLELSEPVEELVARWEDNGGLLMPVALPHIYRSVRLPSIHRDPFDRMLIAQTQLESAVLLSDDADIRQYPVPVIW